MTRTIGTERTTMTTTFKAHRSTTTAEFGHTVFIMSSGAGKLDCSIWLTDEEALQLASELRAAVAMGSAAADTSAELTQEAA
jgi:hypothetical protein